MSVLLKDILIGADPEFFLESSKSRQIVAADSAIVPGTKRVPFALKTGFVQKDGTALEMNVNPSGDFKGFKASVDGLFQEIGEGLSTFNLKISKEAVTHRFPQDEWDSLDEESKELGCSSDMNAWTLQENPVPAPRGNLRCAGGHVHIGWTQGQKEDDEAHVLTCASLVRALDWHLGLPSILIDKDRWRRTMYGRAGAFRVKSYGLEYRVLSNFWLRNDELLRSVFNTAKRTAFLSLNGQLDELVENDRVIQLINQSQIYTAKEFLPELSKKEFAHAL